jgi:hypothetical protein
MASPKSDEGVHFRYPALEEIDRVESVVGVEVRREANKSPAGFLYSHWWFIV